MKNAILFHIFLLCICCMACTGTTKEPVADVTLDELPSIFPDYIGLGDVKENPKDLENAIKDLEQITGQSRWKRY